MGGCGSGSWYRWNTNPTLDDCRSLDINRMVRLGAIPKDGWKSGSWVWSDRETGEEKSRINYEADTRDPDNSFLRLRYTIVSTDEKVDCKIRLSRSMPHYGGERLWFVCPITGKRVSKLYLIAGDDVRFVSRHVYKIHYASQAKGPLDRAIQKKWKIVGKTDGHDYPVRPKGMHHKTFEKIMDEFWRQEELCDRIMFARFGAYM